jgi:hypothetical protein
MALSDNGKEVLTTLITEVGKWLIVIAGVATLWLQSHNQHDDRMKIEAQAIHENNERLDRVAAEVKATARPLVFGGKE